MNSGQSVDIFFLYQISQRNIFNEIGTMYGYSTLQATMCFVHSSCFQCSLSLPICNFLRIFKLFYIHNIQDRYKVFHARLPLVVAETLLRTDSQIELPLWLVKLFKVTL